MDNLTDIYIDSIALIEKKNIIGKLFNMEITERGVHTRVFIMYQFSSSSLYCIVFAFMFYI